MNTPSIKKNNFLGVETSAMNTPCSLSDAVNVTKIAEAALLSSEKGIPIYLDLK